MQFRLVTIHVQLQTIIMHYGFKGNTKSQNKTLSEQESFTAYKNKKVKKKN